MTEKHYPTADDLRSLAMIMRAFADTCDDAIAKMAENKVSELPIDNWETATRGLDYVDRAMRAISSAYVLSKTTLAVRDLLAVYKSQKTVEPSSEKKRTAKK